MNWIKNAAGRAAGALQGARDAMRGVTYEPLEGRSEVTGRERAVDERWQGFKDPATPTNNRLRIVPPRDRRRDGPRRPGGQGKQAARAAQDAEQDARDWEAARASWDNEQEAGS